MIDTEFNEILSSFDKSGTEYAMIDLSEKSLGILSEDGSNKCITALMSSRGWKKQKDTDQYMYSMHPMLHFSKGDLRIDICFQLACRSTLNDAWIPLDRCINIGALKRKIRNPEDFFCLSPEDMTCYLLAKAIYTEKCFSDTSINMIEKSLAGSDRSVLMPKLEKVFFRFTDKLLSMLENGQYDKITEALFSYAGY